MNQATSGARADACISHLLFVMRSLLAVLISALVLSLAADLKSYLSERTGHALKLDGLQSSSSSEAHELKRAREFVEEADATVADVRQRLQEAYQVLERYLVSHAKTCAGEGVQKHSSAHTRDCNTSFTHTPCSVYCRSCFSWLVCRRKWNSRAMPKYWLINVSSMHARCLMTQLDLSPLQSDKKGWSLVGQLEVRIAAAVLRVH